MRKESRLPDVEEIVLRVRGACERSNEEAIEFAIERGDVNAILLTLRRRVIGSKVEEMLTVGEKKRPAVCGVVFGIELGDRSGSTTGDGNLMDDVTRPRSEENDAAGAPSAAAGRGRVTQTANHTGVDLESFEFTFGEEADTRTVGRPERIDGAVGPGKSVFRSSAERTKPEFTAGAENERAAVWGKSGLCAHIAFDFEGSAGGRNDGGEDWERGSSGIGATEKDSECDDRSENSQGPGEQLAAILLAGYRERGGELRGRIGAGDGFQFEGQVTCGLPAVVGILGKAAADHVIDRARRERLDAGDGGGLFFKNSGNDAELTLAPERALAGEHFVEDCAEREDIAAAVEFPAFHLFRRHILKGTDDGALLGDRRSCRNVSEGDRIGGGDCGLGEAEVQQLGAGFGEHNVPGLQVSVDYARAVSLVERVGDFGANF